jgi:hypothetical protein
MALRPLPPLPGVDPATVPTPDEPGYCDWVERVVFSPEGVDRMLIWEQLHRTPTERLRAMQALMNDLRIGDRGGHPDR